MDDLINGKKMNHCFINWTSLILAAVAFVHARFMHIHLNFILDKALLWDSLVVFMRLVSVYSMQIFSFQTGGHFVWLYIAH